MEIRLEQKEERRAVETLVRESFYNVYRLGCLEHYLLHLLRESPIFIPQLNFVPEKEGLHIGQIAFARAEIVTDEGKILPIATVGPLSILPAFQR